MSGRLALVIGSEFKPLGELDFIEECASDLHVTLTTLGGWEPAGGRSGPVVNPSTVEMATVVGAAFAEASARQATLLLAFIGHGQSDGAEDYYLFATDSTLPPKLHTAFNLPEEIRDNLKTAADLDGLIILADACEAGEGVSGAGERWVKLLIAAGGRMDLMVASAATSAYAGCFTRTLVTTARKGRGQAGEYLLCSDFKPSLVGGCPYQTPLLLSFDGVTVVPNDSADRGLYLVTNVARQGSALAGTPAADRIDQLTRGVIITDTVAEAYQELCEADGQRLRAVVGPAGAGKSTLVSLLLRPEFVAADSTRITVHASVFLDNSATRETLAASLADQLSRSVTGFSDAVGAVKRETNPEEFNSLDAMEVRVCRPLARCRTRGTRVRVLIDGLDQPEPRSRQNIVAAVAALADPARDDLGHVRVIVTARQSSGVIDDPGLAHVSLTDLRPPSPAELSAAVQAAWGDRLQAIGDGPLTALPDDGGWLIARLLRETEKRFLPQGKVTLEGLVAARWRQAVHGLPDAGSITALLSVLTAAGAGAVLPIDVLSRAMGQLGRSETVPALRDLLVRLGALTARSGLGKPVERDGLAHAALMTMLETDADGQAIAAGLDTRSAHQALADVISEYLSEAKASISRGETDSPVSAYLATVGPRHHVRIADAPGTVAVLESLEGFSAEDDRDRWATWLPAIRAIAGPDSAESLTGAARLAFSQGVAGDPAGAVAALERVLAGRLGLLGPDHPDTLATRQQLAYFRGEVGDVRGAAAELTEVLADLETTLGPSHPVVTRQTRLDLAYWRGEAGDPAGAAAALQPELVHRLATLGPDHPDTLSTRHAIAYWHGEAGDANGAVAELQGVLADRERILGPDDPQTLTTRHDLAYWRGEAGDPAGAVAALRDLLTDRERVLGPDDPACLTTRHNMAIFQWRAGDPHGAAILLEAVLADRRAILGARHRHTLSTRQELGNLRGATGDAAGAVAELSGVLSDLRQVLGPDHPETMTTRHNLGSWQGRAGDPRAAIETLASVLRDRLSVLGSDHPHTLTTRYELAYWQGIAGDTAEAVTALQRLLLDSDRVLGPDHPQTIATRACLDWVQLA